MDAERLAEVLNRFSQSINQMVVELRDHPDDPQSDGQEDYPDYDSGDDADDGIDALAGREVEHNDTTEDTILQVPAGDLWRLVNRSRKMVRLAREGKIPSMEARAPLCRAIKALKQQRLVRKPHNPRD